MSFVSPDYVCSPFTSTIRLSSTRVYSPRRPTLYQRPYELRVPTSARRLSITSNELPRYTTDTAAPSTAREEDQSPVPSEHVEDQIDAEDAAQLDLQNLAGTPAMDTVQPSTVLDNPVSADTEADQSAMDGAEPSANRENISNISDSPEPSRTFSRMRKSRSIHYAFDKIVDHDPTGTEPV